MADLATIRAAHPTWNIVSVIDAPGGGTWAVGADGGVFALDGAPFVGSYPGLAAAQRQGNRSFTDIVANQTGGYTLKANDGHTYDFPGAGPPGNTQGAAAAAAPAATPAPAAAAAPDPNQAFIDANKATTQNSAIATINSNLSLLGLPASLGAWAWGEIQKGADPTQVMLDMQATPEFQTRFPAIQQLRDRAAKGENVHVPTPGEYVQFETTAAQLMSAAGLPKGFYDQQSDFTGMLLNQTSPAELADRIALAKNATYNAPPEMTKFLADNYGVDQGSLTAYWLDPDKALPLIQKQFAAAQIGGYASSTGFGDITKAQAEGLQSEGVTAAQAQSGLSSLAQEKPLFTNLAGETDQIGTDTQLSTLTGNAAAINTIEGRRRARQAAFSGGGGAAGGGTGGQGIGSAQ